MCMLAHGFLSRSFFLYDFGHNAIADYVSDYQENIRAADINREFGAFLDNKILFAALAQNIASTIRPLAFLNLGHVTFLGGGMKPGSLDALLEVLGTEGGLFLKPVSSGGGEGVILAEMEDDGISLSGKPPIGSEAVRQQLSRLVGYVATGRVSQAAYAGGIYSRTTNTVRVLTMIDPDTSDPFVAAAAHRIGTAESFPVDNCAAGGLTAAIDVESGVIGMATVTKVYGERAPWHETHPDSGAPIAGVRVPHWDQIIDKVLALARAFTFTPCVGWDIIVTDEGPTFLEGNDRPDLKLHQVHQPLLLDSRVRRFYEYHGVIPT
jgi:Sugar-transfer associated ATP-grasp